MGSLECVGFRMLVEHKAEMASGASGTRKAQSQPGVALGSSSVCVVGRSAEWV